MRNSLVFGEPVTFNKTTNHISPLLVPSLSKNIKDVIVIPFGRLSNLPFEVLFTRPHRNYDYSSAPFLIQRYGVSYTFSANLLSKQNQEAPNANPSALLVAPVNFYQDSLQDLHKTYSSAKQIIQTSWNDEDRRVALGYIDNILYNKGHQMQQTDIVDIGLLSEGTGMGKFGRVLLTYCIG